MSVAPHKCIHHKKQNMISHPRGCAGRGCLAHAAHSLSPLLGLRPRVYTLRQQYQLNCIFDFVDQLLGCHALCGASKVNPRGAGDVVAPRNRHLAFSGSGQWWSDRLGHWCLAGGCQLLIHLLQVCFHHGELAHQLLVQAPSFYAGYILCRFVIVKHFSFWLNYSKRFAFAWGCGALSCLAWLQQQAHCDWLQSAWWTAKPCQD